MRKRKNILTLAVATLVCLTALCTGGGAVSFASAEDGDYYAPVTATGGKELLGQLHDLVTTTHTHYSSYNECKNYAKVTDPAPDGGEGVLEFYTHEPIRYYINDLSTSGSQGTWNREHVWPKSLSKYNGRQLWGTDGAGSDLHHIRPSEVTMNSQRGNDKFGEVANGSPVYSKTTGGQNSQLGGYHAGGVFEPLDSVKGDAARIVLYIYIHYNTYANVNGTTDGGGNSGYFGTLPITNIISAPSEDEAFALLLKWNELDPVDGIETTRNEAVFRIQHNRNPFIDHPEYARAIWNEGALPDEAKLRAFRAAVEALSPEGTLAERHEALKNAISAYRELSAAEREEVAEEIDSLQEEIDAYNEIVQSYNDATRRAEEAALSFAGEGEAA